MLPFGEFVFPTGKDAFISYLAEKFPHEKDNIKNIVDEMDYLYNKLETVKFGFEFDDKAFLQIIQKWGKKSFKEFIDYYITDNKLRSILYSMWLFSSLPESKASSLFSALMFIVHIIESTFYIEGGCDNLAKTLVEFIKNNNGEILYKSLVSQIIIENGIATGVKLQDGKIYNAKVVIANSSAKHTLKNMVSDPTAVSNVVRRRIEKLNTNISTFSLYFAAKINKDIKSPFIESNQIFYLEDENNDKIYESCLNCDEKPFKQLLISEIPYVQKEGYRTFNVYSLMDFDRCSDWKSVKKVLTEELLEKVKKIVGKYIEEIVVYDSATPQTFYRYTLNERGSMYGYENSCDPYKSMKLKNEIGIKNMFLAGHWTEPGGSVYNAMTSGYNAYELALKYLEN